MEYMMGLKIRMYPNRRQEKIFWKNINASRFVYNKLLANSWTDSKVFKNKLDKRYPIPEDYWKYSKSGKLFKASTIRPTGLARITKEKYPWLGDKHIDSDMANNALVSYKSAWSLFHKVHNSGTPKFKRKSNPNQGYRTSNHYSSTTVKNNGGVPSLYNGSIKFLDKSHIRLPKVGRIKVKLSEVLPSNRLVRIATVSIKHLPTGEWFVSLLLKSDEPFKKKLPKTNSQVGYDLNTENFLTDSYGNIVDNPRFYRSFKGRLTKEQRKLSRRARRAKSEGRKLWESKNYQKQRKLVAELHARVGNQRKNFLHTISTTLIKNHDLVVGENLKSKNMLKNHALAMSISDVGWKSFIGMLEYKAPLYGRTFIEVDPAYTTQKCNKCGFKMGTNGSIKLTLKDRKWTCPNCTTEHIRDVNASKNILAKGLVELSKPLTEDSPIYK
uniref:RNA-guided endonuclease InsQ/TnpB family protein n=1 Tax=Companilactobacillus zhongbaensis TaxID=2486009 RepID=UPI00384F532C